jgi:hypothetical protein
MTPAGLPPVSTAHPASAASRPRSYAACEADGLGWPAPITPITVRRPGRSAEGPSRTASVE